MNTDPTGGGNPGKCSSGHLERKQWQYGRILCWCWGRRRRRQIISSLRTAWRALCHCVYKQTLCASGPQEQGSQRHENFHKPLSLYMFSVPSKFKKSGVLGESESYGEVNQCQTKERKKFHNSRAYKVFFFFSVPQIPEGETIFPANKFITTPVEPAQMQKRNRWELEAGWWRGGRGRKEFWRHLVVHQTRFLS